MYILLNMTTTEVIFGPFNTIEEINRCIFNSVDSLDNAHIEELAVFTLLKTKTLISFIKED